MNKDTLVGIVGSVLLVAAMVAVFVYERANAEPFADEQGGFMSDGPRLTGTVAVGASDTKVANVTEARATNVTFKLTWSASNGQDTLRITVTPPADSGIPSSGLTARGDEETLTVSANVPEGSSSAGNWTVKVEFTSAQADPLPGGIQPPVGGMTDSSVQYTVAVTLDE